jgi:hypothetical protein
MPEKWSPTSSLVHEIEDAIELQRIYLDVKITP